MSRRRSFEVPGLQHDNPIPMACRIGPFVMSGGIIGRDPQTRQTPPEVEAQCALMFTNIRRVMEVAGGSTEDIMKVTVWIKDKPVRAHVNKEWLAMFPDPHSRPVRHTLLYRDLPEPVLVQCEITAVLAAADTPSQA